MKIASRSAVLSAAALVTLYGTNAVQARPLQWDPTGASAPTGSDGDGTWNLTNTNWVDLVNGVNTQFQNGDDVTIGLGGNTGGVATYNIVTLGQSLTAGNIVFRPSTAGNPYAIIDSGNGTETLTLNGNIVKVGTDGGTNRIQLSSAMVLSAGNHQIGLSDTPGAPAGGELTINNPITGSGSLELNNQANGFEQYGTLVLLGANSYTGGTNVASGQLDINNSAGLGTGAVNISNAGFLQFGGNGAPVSGGLNFTNAITISRGDYGTTNDTNKYTSALGSANGSGVHTVSGAFTIDSVPFGGTTFSEGRVRADTSRIIISSNIQRGANVPAGTPVLLGLDGDNAGFIELTGNNTGISGIRTLGGVQVEFANENNIGGPSSTLQFNGGNFRPIAGALTNFGTHVINNTTFNAGIVVDDGYQFTVDQNLGQAEATGAINKRGLGTLNLNSTINLRGGASFWDRGVVNVNGSTTLNGLRLRSPTVNINNGATFSTTGGYVSIGIDSFGTDGGPDNATVNMNGNSTWSTEITDFNVSDLANTKGTLILNDTSKLTSRGNLWMARNAGATATVTLNGTSAIDVGTLNADGTRSTAANSFQSIIIGRGAGASGTLTNAGGTIRISGELQVGSENGGTGSFVQSAGSTTINSWFSTGRFGTQGSTDISGGTVTKQGTDNAYVGENSATTSSTFTVRGTGVYNQTQGEFWVGQNAPGTLNLQDSGSFSINNWFSVGRGGAQANGVINMSGGTLTKAGANFWVIGDGGQGTVNQTGGAITSNGTRVGNNTTGTMNLSGGTATFTNELVLGQNASVNGTLNISGTANVTAADVRFGNAANAGGTLNLNGGTLAANNIRSGTGSGGVKVLNLNGGQLRAVNDDANFIGAAITTRIGAGGARIDSNGKTVTVTSALTQATGVTGTLAKSGLGTLRLGSTAASSYTGRTTVTSGGVLAANPVNYNAVVLGGGGATLVGGLSGLALEYGTAASPVAQVKTILTAGYAQPTKFSTGQISATLTGSETVGFNDAGGIVNVRVTLPGDTNLNGAVDFNDFALLQTNFGQSGAGITFGQGDFNYDSRVDFNDFALLQTSFGQAVTAGARPEFTREQYAAVMSITDASQVPEPAALTAIGAAAAVLGGRRRRNRA